MSRFLRPSDFLLTAPPVTFEVNTTGAKLFTIKTVGYDDYTKKILEQSGGMGDPARVTLEKQAESFVSAGLPVRTIFRACVAKKKEKTCTLSAAQFKVIVGELETQAKSVPASVEEIEAVVQKFSNAKGEVVYDDYVDALCICAPKSVTDQAKEAVGATTLTLEERLFRSLSAQFLHGGKEGGQGALRATFRNLDKDHSGQADMGQWVKALKEHGLTNLMSKTSASTMLLQYDITNIGKLSYETLCDEVFKGDFVHSNAGGSNIQQKKEAATPSKLEAPTVKKYLSDLTNSILTCDGDVERQLQAAMTSFSSCFSRLQRKRILRKIWTAFDSDRSQRITAAQFYVALKDASAEFRVEFPEHHKTCLGSFIFPDANRSKVDFDKLLDALCTRDVEKCKVLRQESLVGVDNDELLFGSENDSRVRDFGGTLRVVGDMN